MRTMDFTENVKKVALKRANFKCERCWRSDCLEFHHTVPIAKGGDYSLKNCIVLCHECHSLAPTDPFLLKHLFLRFASIKEMIQYYGVESEQQALEKWKIESGFQKELNNQYQSHSTLVKEKMEEKAKEGAYLGFAHPYGYDYRNNKLVTNQAEARIVKEIYTLYVKGWSLGRIAKQLNKKDIPTKKGRKWGKETVSKILNNPLYCGMVEWEEIIKKGKHEAIINIDDFNNVQIQMSKKSKTYKKIPKILSVDTR